MLDKIKLLLGISSADKDSIINFLIDSVKGMVLRYCRITTTSTDIENIIIDMVVTRYRSRGYGQEAAPQVLSSIGDGDVSLSFKTVDYSATAELTAEEKNLLTPFKRLWQ